MEYLVQRDNIVEPHHIESRQMIVTVHVILN